MTGIIPLCDKHGVFIDRKPYFPEVGDHVLVEASGRWWQVEITSRTEGETTIGYECQVIPEPADHKYDIIDPLKGDQ